MIVPCSLPGSHHNRSAAGGRAPVRERQAVPQDSEAQAGEGQAGERRPDTQGATGGLGFFCSIYPFYIFFIGMFWPYTQTKTGRFSLFFFFLDYFFVDTLKESV